MSPHRTTGPADEPPSQITEASWRTIVDDWKVSDLGIAAFCAQRSIGRNTLLKWSRALGDPAGPRQDRAAVVAPLFVRVMPRDVVDTPSQAPRISEPCCDGTLEVELVGGRRVRIVGDVDAALLAKVVTVLEGLAC